MSDDSFDADSPRQEKQFGAPVFRALLIQVLALVPVLLIVASLEAVAELQVPIAAAAVLQGFIAAVFSRWCRLPSWWLMIQFLFPAGLMAMHVFQLPPAIFLAAFVFFVALYWTSFRTQVPFYPSNPTVWAVVSALLPADKTIRFVDIGSGFGGLVLKLAAQRQKCTVTGIELAPLPWLASFLRARLRGSRGHFVRGDYNKLDFAKFDVVFAYLSPAAMPALWQKAKSEMRFGSLLLSYEFPVPDMKPQVAYVCGSSGKILYGWRM